MLYNCRDMVGIILTPRADFSEQASSRGNVNVVGIGCVAVFVLIVTIVARVAIVFFHIQETGLVHSDTGVVALGSITVPFAANGGRVASDRFWGRPFAPVSCRGHRIIRNIHRSSSRALFEFVSLLGFLVAPPRNSLVHMQRYYIPPPRLALSRML